MRIIEVDNYDELSRRASELLIQEINKKPNSVLGFATGNTCLGMYKELVKSYESKKVSFSKVKSFNLDEYYPIMRKDKRSFHSYMFNNLFNKINIKKSNINLLNSETKDVKKECLNYEKKIQKNPIDIQILGVGVNGHIGFNEPNSDLKSKTRLINLTSETIKSKSKKGKRKIPNQALTMGLETILKANKIILLASGKLKARVIKELIDGKINKKYPITSLNKHKNVIVLVDKEALSMVSKNLKKSIGSENILEECYEKAKEVIKECSTNYGLYASGGKKGYKGVWARDSMISLIGASTDSDEEFKKQFKKSLETLKKYQSKLGQIPNAILKLDSKKPQVDFKSIDSSLWFIIGNYVYASRYKDKNILKKNKKAIEKALTWLRYRDFSENTALEQLPTTDWQDAFPHKYGITISTQALYYKVLELVKDKERLKKLREVINDIKDEKLWNNDFYFAYRWKNHNKYKEIGDWFDSFGNLMAVVFGIADKMMSEKILAYIKAKKIARPYPMKSIYPPIKKTSEYWEDYYYDAKATPNHYLNGGIWPFIGSLYVLALIKMKKFKEAKKELKLLGESNLKSNLFPEWIDPITKEDYGELQAWDAGTYIWAYNSLKKKKVLI